MIKPLWVSLEQEARNGFPKYWPTKPCALFPPGENMVLNTMSTSIRKLSSGWLHAKLKSFRRLLRSLTRDIEFMLKFGCIVSRD
jgi:hypothetical protein